MQLMQAKQIFIDAVENHDPSGWKDYLDRTCGNDPQLRERVAELLEAHTQQNPLFDDAGIFAIQASERSFERPGMMIGPFRILEELGEGGFGVIFHCEQDEPIQREVAVKVLKPGLDSRQVVARFEAERQALAMMEHPNIARVLDAGLAPSGRPYFAMELVQGIPVTEYFDQQQLSLTNRLELFIDVCAAVQHAHLKGIIHRDLKPGNILVARTDGKAVVKVIDFGIAKATGSQRLTDKTLNTNVLGFVGTPAYMSPEQIAANKVDVDTRSDIYSLGVLLYEILTSETPFCAKELQAAGYDEMRRMLLELDPPRPSVRLAAMSTEKVCIAERNRKMDPGRLRLLLSRELDWIAMKAIEKCPSRRYQSANEMAEDIASYLRNMPVRACPPSRIYQLQKFTHRHRIALFTAGLVATALLVGAFLSLWQADRAYSAMRLADQSLENEKMALAKVLRSEANLQRQLYATETAEAFNALKDGDRERARLLLDRSRPDPGKSDHREFAWNYANGLWNALPRKFVGHESGILSAALSPDNRWMASGDRAGAVKVWNPGTGREVRSWNYSNKEVTTVAFSPNSTILATAGQDATVRLWNTSNWEELTCMRGHANTVCSLTWSPDGMTLASGSRDQSVRIWDIRSGTETRRLEGISDVVRQVLWTGDGKRLVVADGMKLGSWTTDDWQISGGHEEHTQNILALAISPDGSMIASGGYDGRVILHSLLTNKVIMRSIAGSNVWCLAFSRSGKYLAAGLADGGPMVWRIGLDGAPFALVRGGLERGGLIRSLAFSENDASLMVATEESKLIQFWDSNTVFGNEFVSFPEDCVEVSTEADLAVTQRTDGSIVVRSFSDGTIQATLEGSSHPVVRTALSKSSRWLATFANDNEVWLWDLQSFALWQKINLVDNRIANTPGNDVQLEFSPDDRFIAVAGFTGAGNLNSIGIWSVTDGIRIRELSLHPASSPRIAFSPDSLRLAVGAGGNVAMFSIADETPVNEHVQSAGQIWHLQFTPDGKQLVTSGDSQGAIVWDADTLRKQSQFARSRSVMRRLAISPDGQTLATAANDNTVRLWHLATGHELFTVLQHTQSLRWVKFASNTKLLVGAWSEDGSRQGVFVFDGEE
jgi:WD40 repeat protein/serine/threonine protein kinase